MIALWTDHTPSRRCAWVDQLRGWAVIVMIEVHCLNVWLRQGLMPRWLHYVNGLVAPSFILCAGYSLVLSTFRPDGTLRPFGPTAKRLGFILLCAYILHTPGPSLADWTVLSTEQKWRNAFQIDVLQCIVGSLLILQGLARLVRRPKVFGYAALALSVAVAWVTPLLWKEGVADGWWLPVRGLVNGNPDRGVTSLFSLFPWLAFAAFGAALGAFYRDLRVMAKDGRARVSEGQWLLAMAVLGSVLVIWGTGNVRTWLRNSGWPYAEAVRLFNMTLPSVAQRAGLVCLAGAALGALERLTHRLRGPEIVSAASRESLLLYMLHMYLIFSLLLVESVRRRTGWDWHTQGWAVSVLLLTAVMGVSLACAVIWRKVRTQPDRMRRLQRLGLAVLAANFLLPGWWTFNHFVRSPELAKEPYPFLNWARQRKGLAVTSDGLSHEPAEIARELVRRNMVSATQ